VKPGNLVPAPKHLGEGDSSTFHFPEYQFNIITRSPILASQFSGFDAARAIHWPSC